MTLPASNLLEVPKGVTDQEAASAEPLAAACRITEQEVRATAVDLRLQECAVEVQSIDLNLGARHGLGLVEINVQFVEAACWTT